MGGRAAGGLVSCEVEVVGGGGLRDSPAVNERTLRRPARLAVSTAVRVLCDI